LEAKKEENIVIQIYAVLIFVLIYVLEGIHIWDKAQYVSSDKIDATDIIAILIAGISLNILLH
jgi:hypothetical protein